MSELNQGWGFVVRGLMRGVGAGVLPAALVVGLLSGCAAEAEPGKAEKASATAGATDTEAVQKGGSVGAAGSPCPLPVSFDLAAAWTAEAVKDDPTFGTVQQGPVKLVCEIDAKPAGHIGFIRVWTGGAAGDDPRKALEAFVADEAKDRDKVAYTPTKAGEYAAAEVTYLNTNEFLDEPKKERAVAFTTPRGLVVLHLGGFDTGEHEQMLPAYELAKKTVRAA
ncbi:lipoprotein [Streptomyces sp. NPDC020681]|uniref:lipoprotein n=1 Tax=Streptomyces sp. NPDC020681 TaxID=3365083 RepID=UPI0037B85E2C